MRKRTEHGLGARFTGKLEVCDVDVAARTQGLGHHRAARLYGIRMRLGTYVESANKARVDARAGDRVARRGHRDGNGVFVEPRAN